MRYTSAYALKKTSVSDTTKASVSASSSAVNGTQSLKVNKLAKAGYLTGAQLDDSVTGTTKLSELKDAKGNSYSGTGTISVTTGGKTTEISVNENTTVNEFVQKLQDAGLKASFDSNNKRIFISSSDSGKKNDFVLNGSDENGVKALSSLGVFAASASNSSENAKYAALANKTVDELKASIQEVANNYQIVSDKTTENTALKAKIDYAKAYQSNVAVQAEAEAAGKAGSLLKLNALLDESSQDSRYVAPDGTIYGNREEVKDEEGNVTGYKYYNETTNEQGETEKTYYNAGATIDKEDALPTITEKIKEYAKDLGLVTETTTGEEGSEVTTTDDSKLIAYKANKATISAYEAEDENAAAVAEVKGSADLATDIVTMETTYSDNATAITNANSAISANSIYDVNSGSYADADFDALATALYNKIQTAYEATNGAYSAYNNSGAVRVDGEDSEIVLNGATFTSSSNSYSINGLSITATGVTNGQEISITTATDVDGIYDKVPLRDLGAKMDGMDVLLLVRP